MFSLFLFSMLYFMRLWARLLILLTAGMFGAQGNVPFRSTTRPFFNVKGHYEGNWQRPKNSTNKVDKIYLLLLSFYCLTAAEFYKFCGGYSFWILTHDDSTIHSLFKLGIASSFISFMLLQIFKLKSLVSWITNRHGVLENIINILLRKYKFCSTVWTTTDSLSGSKFDVS